MPVHSFNAVCRSDAKILILGTMPGIASLSENAYYAHPRNAFWPIIIAWKTQEAASYESVQHYSYKARLQLLKQAGIALWDVLSECERQGSLDSAIQKDTAEPNDFSQFFSQYSSIQRVLFNGKTAEHLYLKRVLNTQKVALPRQAYYCLPSTSPAMASLNLNQKANRWHQALQLQ